MSDNWIIVIPENPEHVPPEEAQNRAVALFQSFAPRADEVEKEVSEGVRFVDCGANFSRVLCPFCGKEVDLDWWDEAMDEEAGAGFPLRRLALPCCGAHAGLNALTYDWPQGFARFSIAAMNAGIPDLSPEQLAALEAALGCRVRKILQHL